jgi:hypothetical protein
MRYSRKIVSGAVSESEQSAAPTEFGTCSPEHPNQATCRAVDYAAGFAAACLYTAGQRVTRAEAAAVTNVTATTIRTHHETLAEQVA